jgi:hypothetical protein
MGEVDRLTAEARARALSDTASRLNQIVRGIRQAVSREELYLTLVDAAAAFASGAALLVVEGESARAAKVRGLDEAREQALSAPIALADAAALADAVEHREPVIASSIPSQVSAPLAAAAGDGPEARVAIFPIVEKSADKEDSAPALLWLKWLRPSGRRPPRRRKIRLATPPADGKIFPTRNGGFTCGRSASLA